MTAILPLVRAGAVAPFILWHRANGVDPEPRLAAAGLPTDLLAEPQRPIALLAAARFLVAASRAEGPDFACASVTDHSILDLGGLGQIVRSARTPREALTRAARAYTCHGSHEQFTVSRAPGGAVVRHDFRVPFDQEQLHCAHLYVAAMVREAVAGAGYRGPRLAAVAIVPHPVHGLGHVQARFEGRVSRASGRALELTLTDELLDRPYVGPARERAPQLPDGWAVIRGDGTLAYSIRTILPDLLAAGGGGARQIAELAFTTPRTLQRRLAGEGTHVTRLVDEARRTLALDRLAVQGLPIEELSMQLGYGAASSFTRAVRRWTGRPPRALRSGD